MPKSLPFEIKDMILSHITPANPSNRLLYVDEPDEVTWTPSEIRTLLFVDVQFRDKCLKTLYSSINITSPSMLVKLLNALIKHPHLRPLVKTAYYSFPLEWQDPEWKAHSLWVDILSVLKKLFFDVYDFSESWSKGWFDQREIELHILEGTEVDMDSSRILARYLVGTTLALDILSGCFLAALPALAPNLSRWYPNEAGSYTDVTFRDNFGETLISFARVDEGVRRRMKSLRLDRGEEPEAERENEDDVGGVDWLECSVIFPLICCGLWGAEE
jgi:hypothetical protein